MKKHLGNQKGFSFVNLIMVLVIVFAVIAFSTLYERPALDKETQEVLESEGIDTSNYKDLLDSTVTKIHELEKKHYSEEDVLKRYGQ